MMEDTGLSPTGQVNVTSSPSVTSRSTEDNAGIAGYFQARSGPGALVLRVLATWALLFGSKFVILEIVDIVFGDRVDFGGLIPFIILVVALLAAEKTLTRIYDSLG